MVLPAELAVQWVEDAYLRPWRLHVLFFSLKLWGMALTTLMLKQLATQPHEKNPGDTCNEVMFQSFSCRVTT